MAFKKHRDIYEAHKENRIPNWPKEKNENTFLKNLITQYLLHI